MTKKSKAKKGTKRTSQGQERAVPPPDDPMRRAQEFDPNREYKSREMAEKRLKAFRKTQAMPTSEEKSPAGETEQKPSNAKSDSS